MEIENKNGRFRINVAQYNYLMSTFKFDYIDASIVQKTYFIDSSFEYIKADKIFKTIEYKHLLRVYEN